MRFLGYKKHFCESFLTVGALFSFKLTSRTYKQSTQIMLRSFDGTFFYVRLLY